MLATTLVYLGLSLCLPIGVFLDAINDDAFYITKAESILQGNWLGPIDQYTLQKGPLLSLVIAGVHWTQIPFTLFLAAFYATSSATAALVCGRAFRARRPQVVALYIALLFLPAMRFVRIYRSEILADLVLLMLAAGIWCIFVPSRRAWIAPASVGLVVGLASISQEDAVWMFPFAILAVGWTLTRELRTRKWARAFAIALGAMVAWALPSLAIDAVNFDHYGVWEVTDFTDGSMQDAVKALSQIQAGPQMVDVPVSGNAIAVAESVSPTMRTLEDYYSAAPAPWTNLQCTAMPSTCGQIGGAYFVWSLRDAVASVGGYRSAATAEGYYRRIADEISAACRDGRLSCSSQPIAALPTLTSATLERIPGSFWRALQTSFEGAHNDEPASQDSLRASQDTLGGFLGPRMSSDVPSARASQRSAMFAADQVLGRPFRTMTPGEAAENPGVDPLRSSVVGSIQFHLWHDSTGVLDVVNWLGLLALLAGWALIVWKRASSLLPLGIGAALVWLLWGSRIAILAVTDAALFPSAGEVTYVKPVIPIALLASALSILLVLRVLRAPARSTEPLDNPSE